MHYSEKENLPLLNISSKIVDDYLTINIESNTGNISEILDNIYEDSVKNLKKDIINHIKSNLKIIDIDVIDYYIENNDFSFVVNNFSEELREKIENVTMRTVYDHLITLMRVSYKKEKGLISIQTSIDGDPAGIIDVVKCLKKIDGKDFLSYKLISKCPIIDVLKNRFNLTSDDANTYINWVAELFSEYLTDENQLMVINGDYPEYCICLQNLGKYNEFDSEFISDLRYMLNEIYVRSKYMSYVCSGWKNLSIDGKHCQYGIQIHAQNNKYYVRIDFAHLKNLNSNISFENIEKIFFEIFNTKINKYYEITGYFDIEAFDKKYDETVDKIKLFCKKIAEF